MIEFLKGRLVEKNPAHLIIDCNGVGYFVNISLNTYSAVGSEENVMIYIHQVIREDAHLLFGFKEADERKVFRSLLGVSGVGANTARTILSSMTPDEVREAITLGNVKAFEKIKGIGGKTAQRIIVDLSGKLDLSQLGDSSGSPSSLSKNEALSALTTLGFDKNAAEKAIDKILATHNNMKVEELIKMALKNM
jgi:Holliday junction DNA helicase RuvA